MTRAGATAVEATAPRPTVEIGAAAPDFELSSQHGERIALSSFRGHRNVLCVFYPFVFSGICGDELGELRDRADEFSAAGTELLGLSCDSVYSLRGYADAQRVYFSLLSDFWPHGRVARAYGVFDESVGAAVRGSFLIDRDGVLRWSVVNPIGESRTTSDYLDAIAAL